MSAVKTIERKLLASVLQDPSKIDLIQSIIKTEDAFSYNGADPHRDCWRAMLRMSQAGTPIDDALLVEELSGTGVKEPEYFVGLLISDAFTAFNHADYARKVRSHHVQRLLAGKVDKMQSAVHTMESKDAIAFARAQLDEIDGEVDADQERGLRHISQFIEEVGNEIERIIREGKLPGLPTGFVDLDRMMGGLQRSDFIVLGARPAMGKSALSAGIAKRSSAKHGANVAYFTIEMTNGQITARLLSAQSKIPS